LCRRAALDGARLRPRSRPYPPDTNETLRPCLTPPIALDDEASSVRRSARLASKNPGKLRELRRALSGWEIEPLEVEEYPPETGATYYENARSKAEFGHSLEPSAWVLGEDSGLEVDGLGGRPGVESARFARGEHVGRLLAELDGVEDRRARYVCELVAVSPEGEEQRGTGVLKGRIVDEPRGTGGFGFDPIFVPEDEEQTVAELGDEWKAANSHRARAAQALTRALESLPDPPRGPGRSTN
jgi:XTP/dITP diphosphohydrolase